MSLDVVTSLKMLQFVTTYRLSQFVPECTIGTYKYTCILHVVRSQLYTLRKTCKPDLHVYYPKIAVSNDKCKLREPQCCDLIQGQGAG